MERLTYLMTQQGLQEPPLSFTGTSSGNTIKLDFSAAIRIREYVCSIVPISFALSNCERNITSQNNKIEYDDGVSLKTITITPGIYEFSSIAELVKTETNENIIISLNTNSGLLDIIVKDGYALYSSDLLINPSNGMYAGFVEEQFPVIGPDGISSMKTPYVTKYNTIYCQCNIINADTRIVYNNITLNRPILFSTSLAMYSFEYVYLVNFSDQLRSKVISSMDEITSVEFQLIHEDGTPVQFDPDQNSEFYIHVLLKYEKFKMNEVRLL